MCQVPRAAHQGAPLIGGARWPHPPAPTAAAPRPPSNRSTAGRGPPQTPRAAHGVVAATHRRTGTRAAPLPRHAGAWHAPPRFRPLPPAPPRALMRRRPRPPPLPSPRCSGCVSCRRPATQTSAAPPCLQVCARARGRRAADLLLPAAAGPPLSAGGWAAPRGCCRQRRGAARRPRGGGRASRRGSGDHVCGGALPLPRCTGGGLVGVAFRVCPPCPPRPPCRPCPPATAPADRHVDVDTVAAAAAAASAAAACRRRRPRAPVAA